MSNQIFMHGEFHTLYDQSIADDVKFLNYFRMSHPIFQELLAIKISTKKHTHH